MSEYSYPDFDELAELLLKHNLDVNPAEFHGLISGLFAAGMAGDEQWLHQINDIINNGEGLPVEIKGKVANMHMATFRGLSDSLLGFQLLLPDDDYAVEERVEALALWVQSFLVGFGLRQSKLNELSDDVQELIQDFSEISQLSTELEGNEEDNEKMLFEVIEYIRVGAVTIFAYLNPQVQDEGDAPTLH